MKLRNIQAVGITSSLLAALAAILLLNRNTLAEKTTNQVENLKPAPGWELRNLDGQMVRLTDFKGKVVILDFWATWCPPCRAEIPGLIALQKQYGKQGLAVVGISVNQDGAAAVKPFVSQQGINYPVVMADAKVQQAYGGIEAIPTTFIIDRKGRIITRHLGYTSKAEFEKEIKPLLAP